MRTDSRLNELLTVAFTAALVGGCAREPTRESSDATETRDRTVSALGGLEAAGLPWDPLQQFATLATADRAGRAGRLGEFYRRWGAADGEAAALHAEREGILLASVCLREAFRGWLAADAEAPRQWVRGIDVPRRLATHAGALSEALPDTVTRADWIASLDPQTVRQRLLSRVMVEWGRGPDPAAGLDWLASSELAGSRADEVGQLVRAWADQDSFAASQALATMPEGSARDAAVAALATVVAADEPAAARRWVETIADQGARAAASELVGKISGGVAGLP